MDERPFACTNSDCNWRFANAADLRIHLGSHEQQGSKAAAKALVTSTEIILDIDPCKSFSMEVRRLRVAEINRISQSDSSREVTYDFGMPMRRQVQGYNQAMTRKSEFPVAFFVRL